MDNTAASLLKYERYRAAKSRRRPQPRPHWSRLARLRQYRPAARPDQLAETWSLWVEAHGGNVDAALGALVVERVDDAGESRWPA